MAQQSVCRLPADCLWPGGSVDHTHQASDGAHCKIFHGLCSSKHSPLHRLLLSCLACLMDTMVRRSQCSPSAVALLQRTVPLPQETLEDRGNSHELFGYDFVVDDSLNVWLIEVNCSPSLEHSTPVTGRMVTGMVDDLFKVGGMLLCSINTAEQKVRLWPVTNPVPSIVKVRCAHLDAVSWCRCRWFSICQSIASSNGVPAR